MRSVVFVATSLGLCNSVISKNLFNRPPSGGVSGDYRDNPTYKEGERIEFLWNTDLTYVDIAIWQKYPTGSNDGAHYSAYIVQNTSSTSYEWTAVKVLGGVLPPEGENSIFWLTMHNASEPTQTVTDSHYFNVSRVLPTTTELSSSAIATPTAEITTPSATADAQTPSSGLSTGAVAGIAVGATLACILLLVVIAFFIWRRLQKPKNNTGLGSSGAGYKLSTAPTSEVGQSTTSQHQQTLLPPNYHQHDHALRTTGSGLPENHLHEAP